MVMGVLDHNRVYTKDQEGKLGHIVLRVSDNWQLWEPPKVKRELKATDLIGWWATNGLLTGPILVDSGFDKVKIHVEWWHVRNLETWRFTKDPSTPLDQWQTLEEICGGES